LIVHCNRRLGNRPAGASGFTQRAKVRRPFPGPDP
jgi:hypothetical protein